MPKFEALEEALDEDLVLPMRGSDGKIREYRVAAPTWPDMLRARAMGEIADGLAIGQGTDEATLTLAGAVDDQSVHEFALGKDTLAAVIADGVGAEMFARAVTTALFFRMGNTASANAVWSGKAQNQRIRSARTGGEDAATPKASTSGTSTPKKSRKK